MDGHTIDELSDYLDSGRQPRVAAIENSPDCQLALAGLARLHRLTLEQVEADVEREPAPTDSWVQSIMNRIALEANAGRDIPISYSDPQAVLSLSEGAVRGIIRGAGDHVQGVIVGRCRLDGDVTLLGEPITIRVEMSVAWGENIPAAASQLRQTIADELHKHTEITIQAIDITVNDVRVAPRAAVSTIEA
ncbi:Asp23/Gls24 family envelope stress response protein [Microterricola viridarii]|uniref:Asp23/Gls24 family envelope stress response protein n=1 Tax=Microterricola viridarii TaxID=412690 RepID=UPI001F39E8CF|nr:Asp23/Gls24 family envelope stress response protein [Microterricola viridarii]